MLLIRGKGSIRQGDRLPPCGEKQPARAKRISRGDGSEKDQGWPRAWALELNILGFEFRLYLLLAVRPWVSRLTFLGLCLNFDMGITMLTSKFF